MLPTCAGRISTRFRFCAQYSRGAQAGSMRYVGNANSMKIVTFILSVFLLVGGIGGYSLPPQATKNTIAYRNLLPVPASVTFRSGRLAIGADFSAATNGHNDPRLLAGIARATRRIELRTGLEFKRAAGNGSTAVLVVECQNAGKAIPSLDEDESYTLDVTDNHASLQAAAVLGALRGRETLLHL